MSLSAVCIADARNRSGTLERLDWIGKRFIKYLAVRKLNELISEANKYILL